MGQLTELGVRVVEAGESMEDAQPLELPETANSNSLPSRDE